jgi:hypothetical protein
MSIWVRALCSKPAGDMTPEMLRSGISERLAIVAAYYGEDGAEAVRSLLRIEDAGDAVWLLHYQGGDDHFLRIERWTKPAAVAEEVGELRERLEDCDEDGVEEVRELLDHVVETVGVELKMSDVEGIGWAVAVSAAACFAERGEGLVQADEEGWMAPEGLGVEQVLDGD